MSEQTLALVTGANQGIGYVATELTGFQGFRTPKQGAAIAVKLATLPDDGPTGQLFDDDGVLPW